MTYMDTTEELGIEESIQEMKDSCTKPEKVTLYNFFKINTPDVIKVKLGITTNYWSNNTTQVTSSNGLLETLRQYQDDYNLNVARLQSGFDRQIRERGIELNLGSYGYQVFNNAIREQYGINVQD